MTPKELPYDDREITIRDRETVKLSELTKDERDIYFAGVDDGHERATFTIVISVLVVTAIIIAAILIISKQQP